MATQRFSGSAAATAQVNTITVGGTAALNQVYSVTIGGVTVSYTATGGDSNTTIATALAALLAKSAVPQFAQQTWVNTSAGVITVTARTPGTFFTQTSGATGSGTFVTATTIPNSSPNDWSNAGNWLSGSVPVTGDDVYLDLANVPILMGFAQSGVTLNSLWIPASFTSALGLPQYNPAGYQEYRPTYLSIGATTITVGYGPGNGSPLLRINCGSIQTTLVVNGTAPQSTETNAAAFQWQGTNASNVVAINKGNVGLAKNSGESATIATLTVNFVSQVASDATVFIGSGATLTTINQYGGTLTTNGSVTTKNHYAGTHTAYDSTTAANVTTLSLYGGTVNYNGSGTITTLNVNGATVNFSQNPLARTVTNCTVYAGATISDPEATVTWSNPISVSQCTAAQVDLNFGYSKHLQPS